MDIESKFKNIIDLNEIYIESIDLFSNNTKKLYGNSNLKNQKGIKIIESKNNYIDFKLYLKKNNTNILFVINEFNKLYEDYMIENLKNKINYFSELNKKIENDNIKDNIIPILKNFNKLIKYNKIYLKLTDKDNVIIENTLENQKNQENNKNIKTYKKSNLDFNSEIIIYTKNKLNSYEEILVENMFNKIINKLINQIIFEKTKNKSMLFDNIQKFHSNLKEGKDDLNKLLAIITSFGNKINYKVNIGLFINNKIYIDYKTKKKEILNLEFKDKEILYEKHQIFIKIHINKRLTYLVKLERKTAYFFEEILEEERAIVEGILKNTYLSQSLKNITALNKSKINILNSLYELNKDFASKSTKNETPFVKRLNKVLCRSYKYETLTIIDIYHNHIIKSVIKDNESKQEKIRLTDIELKKLQEFPKIYSIKLKSIIYNLDRYKITIPIIYKNELISILILSSKFKKININIDKRIEPIFLNNLSSLIHSNNSYIKLKKTNTRLVEMVEEQNKENKNLLAQYQAKSDFLSIMLSNIPEAIIVFDINNNQNNKLIMFNQKAIKNFTILPEMSYQKFKEKNGFKEEIKNDAEIYSEKSNKFYKIYEENLTEKYLKNYMGEEKYYEGLNIILLQNITKFKELDTLKSDFISNISHEFRTPLTSISGYTNLILMGKFGKIDDKQKEALDIIASESKRLSQLINDVLDISKLESGKIEINKSKVNIYEVAENIKRILKGYSNDKKISIINEIKKDTIIFCDENKIQQVLINLIDNAIKYNSSGGWVKMKYLNEKEWDNIIIEDNGIGISEDNAKHLFDKFYQVESIMFKSKIGTGLGLSISKQIIDLHEGEIKIESKLNKGSKFIIKLKKN